MKIDKFRGVDLTSSLTQVSVNRSPDAVNMLRNTVGSIRKRMGYEEIGGFESRVRGVYIYNGKTIIHAGNCLYEDTGELLADFTDLGVEFDNDVTFFGFEMGGKLYIKSNCGGAHSYLVYSESGAKIVLDGDMAYIPHVFAGKRIGQWQVTTNSVFEEPRGGEFLQPFNLAGYRWAETFGGEMPRPGQNVNFIRLARRASRIVKIERLQEDGEWGIVSGNNIYFLEGGDRIRFSAGPLSSSRPAYVLDGEDWIRVIAEYVPADEDDIPDNVKSFRRSNILGFGGVNGARNVVLFGGDAEKPNQFFYSKEDNPTYFPDTNFAIIGEPNSAIMGFSTVDGRLAVYKDGREDVAVYMCNGEFEKDEDGILKTIFRITGSVKGDGVVSKRCFASIENDPLFLTRNGVNALTTRDILGGTIAQSRSYFINGELKKFLAEELHRAHVCVYNNFYMLCIDGKIYCLDGLQKAYDWNEPQSAFQYECYVLDNIPADFMWANGDDLYFVQNIRDGAKVYKFFSDKDDVYSYSDGGKRNSETGKVENGAEIKAYWDLPELYGNLFYQKKTFLYLAVQLDAAVATGVELWAKVRGLWRKIGENFSRGRYFSWSNIVWSKWTWSADRTTRALTKRFRLKKLDKARYRLQNQRLNEPFAVYSIALEFTENGGKIR